MSDETQVPLADNTESSYIQPAIVHELMLETRAGSPIGGSPMLDPLGIDPTIPK